MSLIGSLTYFDLIWSMTQGGPNHGTELMATYMYKNSFKFFKMGYGSAVAAGMFILITLIVMAVLSLSGKVLSGNELAQVTGLRKLAVIPDRKKLNGPLDRLIARLDTEQKNTCAKELRYLAAAEAILAQTGSKASVLLIGHVGEDALDQCAADLRRAFQADNVSAVPEIISADLRDGMADGLRFLRETAGVVLVEEIEKSGYASITGELSALEARNTNLLGYILL